MIESNVKKDLEHKIDLYVNGKLSQDQVDELWAELIQDGYYLDYTKSVANIKAVIESQRLNKNTAPVYKLRKIASYGTAAAIAIIIGVISVINFSGNDQTFSLQAVNELDLGEVRGDSELFTPTEVIAEAIELANNGNVEQAVTLLEREIDRTEDPDLVAEISLTLGSIQYNYGEYDAALLSFERVISQNTIDVKNLDKGYWYLANTYLQLGMLDKAESAFRNVYELDQGYSRIAKTYLDAFEESR
ncbi:MAG: tetratricopeptide repeat protein [Balneola sp.]|nr:MAG: tetratricopeptide repeat protein [Balneola sp.]